MIDINKAPDKKAKTLAAFLVDCALEDPYIQNIYTAARYLVETGCGHVTYKTQWESGVTYWEGPGSAHSIPRIPYCPTKPRIVITIHRGLLASVVSDVPFDVEILKVDEDPDGTIYREESIEVNPDYIDRRHAEAEEFWQNEELEDEDRLIEQEVLERGYF